MIAPKQRSRVSLRLAVLALAAVPAGCGDDGTSSYERASARHATDPLPALPSPRGRSAGSERHPSGGAQSSGDDLPSAGNLRATFVGDSVADAITETPPARRKLTHGLHMKLDLKVCRRLVATSCTYQGSTPTSALGAVRSSGRSLGSVLVVDAGYNDGAAGSNLAIDSIVRTAKAQGVQRVVWVTLREAGTYPDMYRTTNGEIFKAARRWPQLRVADWNAYSAGKPWFGSDGLHLSPTGAVALARFLRPYVTGER